MLRASANLKEVGTTKHDAEEHEVHTRQITGVRWPNSLKPNTDMEQLFVNATAMRAKVKCITRGDLTLDMKVSRRCFFFFFFRCKKSAAAILR